MTVTSINRSQVLACDGITTSWPVAFGFDHPRDLAATLVAGLVRTPLAWPADFDADANDNQGGTFTTSAVYPAGAVIELERKTLAVQERAIGSKARLDLAGIERALDRLTWGRQDEAALRNAPSTRVLRLPDAEAGEIDPLPAKSVRADRVLGFDAAGRPVAVDLPEGGGGGGAVVPGSLHGLLADRTTDETSELQAAIDQAIADELPGITFEGPAGRGIRYDGLIRIRNETERPFTVSFRGVDLLPGPDAEIRGDGRIRELPQSGLFKLWADVDATGGPVTVFDIDAAAQAGDVAVLAPGSRVVIRGENDTTGEAFDSHTHEDTIVSVAATGTANRFTLTLQNGLPGTIPGGIWRRDWPDSQHPKAGEPGFVDQTLISVIDEVLLEADVEDSDAVPLPAAVPLSRYPVGDWVLLQDDTVAGDFVGTSAEPLMRQTAKVAAHDAASHALVLDRPVRGRLRVTLDDVAKRARVTGLIPCFDLTIEGPRAIAPVAPPGAARRHIVNFRHCVRARSHGFVLDGRRIGHDVRGALIREHLSADGRHWGSERWYPHHVTTGGDGNGVWLKGSSGSVVEGMLMVGCRHGITPGSGVAVTIRRNVVVDSREAGIDCGHGENGQGITVEGNLVVAGPAGIERPRQKGIEASNFGHLYGDRGFSIRRNRLVGFHGEDATAILLRAGAIGGVVEGNEITGPAGIGIAMEAHRRAPAWPIERVTVAGDFSGCKRPVVIDGRAPAWNADDTFEGTASQPTHVEHAGELYSTAASTTGGDAPVHTSGTVGAWTHAGQVARPIRRIALERASMDGAAVPFAVDRCDRLAVRQLTIRDAEGPATLADAPAALIGPALVDQVGDGTPPWLAIGTGADGTVIVHPRVGGAAQHSSDSAVSVVPLAASVSGEGGGGVVSVTDFGADPTGTDAADAAVAAMLAEHGHVHFSDGRFKLASTVTLPPMTHVTGEGITRTEIISEAATGFATQRIAVAPFDWSRCHLEGFTLTLSGSTTTGILVDGHETILRDIVFRGGVAGGWCVDALATNEFLFENLSGGWGGFPAGIGDQRLFSNGIRVRALDTTGDAYGDQRKVNYGDGAIENCRFKVKAVGAVGLKMRHESTDASLGVINNVLVSNSYFQATGDGVDDDDRSPIAPGSPVTVYDDSIGVDLYRAKRNTFVNVNVESNATGFKLRGSTNDQFAAGSTTRNSFVGCQGQNTTTKWDADDTAQLNWIEGGQDLGPMQPTGIASDDVAGRRGPLDSFVPGAVWFARPQGDSRVGIRVTESGKLVFVSDYQHSGSDIADGMPKSRKPYKGLVLDIAGSAAAQKIQKLRGYEAGYDARIEIGNGPGLEDSAGGVIGALHRVQVNDPFHLLPLSALPPALGGNVPGVVVNAANPAALGGGGTLSWTGPGWYGMIDDRASSGGSFASTWVPMQIRPGMGLAQPGRAASAYTLDRSQAGRTATYTSAVLQTITVPADLWRDAEGNDTDPNILQPSLRFRLVAGLGGLAIVPGAGVTLLSAEAVGGAVTVLDHGAVVEIEVVRTGNEAAPTATAIVAVDRRGGLGSGEIAIGSAGVTNPSAGQYAYTVPSSLKNALLSASFADPDAVTIKIDGALLAPAGPPVAELFVRNAGTGGVAVTTATSTTAASGALAAVEPGETVHYLIERTGAASWLLSNVTQSPPPASAGSTAATAVTLDDTGMGIAAGNVQAGIAALDAKVTLLEADIEGSDDIVVASPPGDDTLAAAHASGRVTRRAVLFENAAPLTLALGADFFPAGAGVAREYNLLLEGGRVELDLGLSDAVITPGVASDAAMQTFDGSDPGNEAASLSLGGAGFRPAGTGQVAVLTLAVTHRTADAFTVASINADNVPSFTEPLPLVVTWPAGVSAVDGIGNGAHVATDATPGFGQPWHAAPTYRTFLAFLGDATAPADFTVTIETNRDVYAASASLVILDDWQRVLPAVTGGEAVFTLEGNAELRRNGGAPVAAMPNGVRVVHYHGLDLAAAPAEPPVALDDGSGVDAGAPALLGQGTSSDAAAVSVAAIDTAAIAAGDRLVVGIMRRDDEPVPDVASVAAASGLTMAFAQNETSGDGENTAFAAAVRVDVWSGVVGSVDAGTAQIDVAFASAVASAIAFVYRVPAGASVVGGAAAAADDVTSLALTAAPGAGLVFRPEDVLLGFASRHGDATGYTAPADFVAGSTAAVNFNSLYGGGRIGGPGAEVAFGNGATDAQGWAAALVVVRGTNLDGEAQLGAAFAAAGHATNFFNRGVAAVVVGFATDDIVGTVTNGGDGSGRMREFVAETTLHQAPEPEVTYRGPDPLHPGDGQPRAVKLLARAGKQLAAVNI